jgi:hypothetical protein
MKHLWIPDTQIREGVPVRHIDALANYIVDKRPDKIIIAGDWWDFPSVSHWNTKREQETQRLQDDIGAGNRALHALLGPIQELTEKTVRQKRKAYRPEIHFLMGNHEDRLQRFIDANPVLEGLLGFHLLSLHKYDIQVHPFKQILNLDGIRYCHFFYRAGSGSPYTGMIETKIKNIGFSFTQGHMQEFAYGERQLPDGQVHHGLVAGAFYLHDETYKGPQANAHWRGVVMKHEVRNGEYDISKISARFLLSRYL